MPSPFEAEIHVLLQEQGDPSGVADELLRRWNLNLLNEDEIFESANFLLHAGLHSRLFRALESALKSQSKMPWGAVVEALGEARVKIDPLEAQALLYGARAQEAELDLARSRKLDDKHSLFRELQARFLAERALKLEARRKELKERIQFLKTGRMFAQEAEALREMEALFPDDQEFARERESFEIRLARDVIARASHSATTPTIDLDWRIEKLEPEGRGSKALIVARAKELIGSRPKLAYDLALALHFMDFNAEAVEVLDLAHPRGPEKADVFQVDWLRLELMLQGRQFLHALDEAARLELAYAGDPETSFSVIYARARALKGLGQDSMAVDLMRSLVKIRPNYKSAHSLLLDWSGGDE